MFRAKYKCGSSLILPNPNDDDYVYYYDTNEERLEALRNNLNHSVDNHYCIFNEAKRIRLFCYIYPQLEHIEGEEIDFKSFSIFDEDVKREYIALLKKNIAHLPKENKRWYHIVIAYFMYKNGEMKLTTQQKEVAQNTHDKGISENMYNKMVDYFNK